MQSRPLTGGDPGKEYKNRPSGPYRWNYCNSRLLSLITERKISGFQHKDRKGIFKSNRPNSPSEKKTDFLILICQLNMIYKSKEVKMKKILSRGAYVLANLRPARSMEFMDLKTVCHRWGKGLWILKNSGRPEIMKKYEPKWLAPH